MRIHIETRTRWRFTITSPNHDNLEKIGPGAKSFACNDLKSTSQGHDRIPKAFGRSPDAYGIAEEVWPESRLPSKVSRSCSFRKRVCRFLVHFSRMHPEVKACAHYEFGDTLPPYERYQVSELPADSPAGSSAVQELPDPLLMTPEILSQEVFELECYTPQDYHVPDVPMNTLQGMSVPSQFGGSQKQRSPSMDYAMHKAFESVETPVYLPSLNTEQHLYALPDMMSEEHSHNSSPVSPFTPTMQGSPGTQPHTASGFSNGAVSPQELVSRAIGQFQMEGQVYQGMQGYRGLPTHATPVNAYPPGLPASLTPIMDNGLFKQQRYINISTDSSSSFQNLMPYQQLSQESLTSQYAVPGPGTTGPQYKDERLGTWENIHGSEWIRQPIQELDMDDHDNTSHLPPGNIATEKHLPTLSPAKYYHYDPSLANESPNEDTTVQYPPVYCNDCGTEFNGRYRQSNLKRHVRGRHNMVKPIPCRVCNQVYKRADATRKHEWKKHRLPVAKPNKRRR